MMDCFKVALSKVVVMEINVYLDTNARRWNGETKQKEGMETFL